MNIVFIGLAILCLLGIEIFIKKFNPNYLSKESTSCIKGIFIVYVFYSHFVSYTNPIYNKDFLMLNTRNFLGQLMVTLFLFYSGYGIYESIKKKGNEYVKKLPVNRILKTLIHFMVAICAFLVLNIVLKIKITIPRFLLSLIGWDSIGNSNWYIFDILVLYIITYISCTIFKNKKIFSIFSVAILTILFTQVLSYFRDPYWYNTTYCYVFGVFYSYFKNPIEKVLKNNLRYIIILILAVSSFYFMSPLLAKGYIIYELYSLLFVLITVLVTLKINITNRVLKWCGDNLFLLYIYQRIPMYYLYKIGYAVHPYRMFLISIVGTIILTMCFKKLYQLIDKLLFNK